MVPGPEAEQAELRLACGVEQRQLTARDGTRIGYQVRGEGPCVVLANGLGGTHITFKHLYGALVNRATKRVAGSDALISAMKRVGLVSQTVDIDVFRAVAAGFQQVDWRIYSDLLTRLDEHDAEEVLDRVDIPVAIITGDRDLM